MQWRLWQQGTPRFDFGCSVSSQIGGGQEECERGGTKEPGGGPTPDPNPNRDRQESVSEAARVDMARDHWRSAATQSLHAQPWQLPPSRTHVNRCTPQIVGHGKTALSFHCSAPRPQEGVRDPLFLDPDNGLAHIAPEPLWTPLDHAGGRRQRTRRMRPLGESRCGAVALSLLDCVLARKVFLPWRDCPRRATRARRRSSRRASPSSSRCAAVAKTRILRFVRDLAGMPVQSCFV